MIIFSIILSKLKLYRTRKICNSSLVGLFEQKKLLMAGEQNREMGRKQWGEERKGEQLHNHFYTHLCTATNCFPQ